MRDIEQCKRDQRLADTVRQYGIDLKPGGSGRLIGKCPFHREDTPSFTVYDDGGYKCFGCGAAGDVVDFVRGMEKCSLPEALEKLGAPVVEEQPKRPAALKQVAVYKYTDEHGGHLFDVVRYEPKTFRQRAADGTWSMKGVPLVLYRMPEVTAAETVWLVEGEEDVHALEAVGVTATTNPGGSKAQWLDSYTAALAGKHVILCPDTDAPGLERHTRVIAALAGRVASLREVLVNPHKDVRDALRAGMTLAELLARAKPAVAPPAVDIDLLPFAFTDTGMAERIKALHGADMRYVPEFRSWLVWDGRRWVRDESDRARLLAMLTARAMGEQAIRIQDVDEREQYQKFAVKYEGAGAIDAALKNMQMLDGVSSAAARLDANPWLLNVQNGTLDLSSCTLRPHDRGDLITKLVHHPFEPGTKCPTFVRFLRDVLPVEIHGYLQQCLGYSLTGVTSEKALFFLHGSGNNGKSTLLDAVRQIIDEYSTGLQMELLVAREQNSNTMSDLADLRGARFAVTSETDEGQKLPVSRIKRLTQGMGNIKACRKYENPITFPETHKLWIDCNHRPSVPATDDALWRRIHLIPFETTIPDGMIDRDLPDKLRAESAGILAWMVYGAAKWRAAGAINKPPAVHASTVKWRTDMDRVKAWLDECARTDDAEGYCTVKEARGSYEEWCKANGEHPLGAQRFNDRLQRAGLTQERRWMGIERQSRVWMGLTLLG